MTLFSVPIRSIVSPVTHRTKFDLIWVIIFFLFVLVVENLLVCLWAKAISGRTIEQTQEIYSISGVYSIAMLCSSAASFVGGLIGFLFGIPRSDPIGQRPGRPVGIAERDTEATGGAGSQPQESVEATSEVAAASGRDAGQGGGLHRNTNLENVSDALTKGLLAIGASQLFRLDGWVREMAATLGPSLGPGSTGKTVALTVLTYGAIAGFLFGYLATRIYLTGVFERNDPQ